jgi:phosphatidylglycerol:prolipoprotein diacylglycerol transferase
LVDIQLRGIPLHPTQLYEAGALLLLFFALLKIFEKRKWSGQVILSYFFIYPIIRSIIEIFRGDVVRGFVIEPWLSTSQFISIVFVAAAGVGLLQLKKFNRG